MAAQKSEYLSTTPDSPFDFEISVYLWMKASRSYSEKYKPYPYFWTPPELISLLRFSIKSKNLTSPVPALSKNLKASIVLKSLHSATNCYLFTSISVSSSTYLLNSSTMLKSDDFFEDTLEWLPDSTNYLLFRIPSFTFYLFL